MSTRPSVTAVIPSYETGELLLRAINSLERQTRPPDEIVVVDDGSVTAEARSALDKAAGRPTVQVLRQPENAGVAAARNRGIDESRSDYVVFLDSDDMFTAPTIAAYLDAFDDRPDADFAYPTVQCFGGRTDTFPPPPFNAYLLHHVNICPIASMVTRRALESGVRFDPSIEIGHEDWDFWLRLTEAGFIGMGVADATLLYRRIGFTRNDLGNQIEGGFEKTLRRIRPGVFSAKRLDRLKREWAPALTIRAADPERSRAWAMTQTCDDVEVLALDAPEPSRGRMVTLEWDADATLMRDPFAVEDLLSVPDQYPSWQWVIHLRESACREGTASGPLQARDLTRGYVDPNDIVAITQPRGDEPATRTAYSIDTRSALLERLYNESVYAPQTIVWRAHHPRNRRLAEAVPQPQPQDAVTAAAASHGWSREVLDTLPPALPWRRAGSGHGLYLAEREPIPSTMRQLIWARDPFGGTSLYTQEEGLLMGSEILEGGPLVHRTQVTGTAALMRVLDPATGERGVSLEPLPEGLSPEAVVGYLDQQAVPGARPFDAPSPRGKGALQRLGWAFGLEDPELVTAHLHGPVVNGRRWWRARGSESGRHVYGFDPLALSRSGASVEGPVFVIATTPWTGSQGTAIHALLSPDGTVVGAAANTHNIQGAALGPKLGLIHPYERDGLRRIALSRSRDTGSFLCSNLPGEGLSEGFVEVQTLGFADA